MLAATVVAVLASPAAADEPCDPGIATRIRFLEERLEARRAYADWWWKGWTGTYGTGTVVQSVRAGLEDDSDAKRADLVISAVKALFGTTRLLLFPPAARDGAAPMRAVAAPGGDACAARLAAGEAHLQRAAREARSRWSWKRHAANLAVNAAGALIVGEAFGDRTRGWRSAAYGVAVGEAMLFTHPWQADDDLADYEAWFGDGAARSPERVRWRVAPWPGGAAIVLAF